VLEGHVPQAILTPHPRHALDRWPERLAGRAVTEVRTHGKHLFLCFEGDLTIHSHLRMTGTWGVYAPGRAGLRPARRPGSPDWAGRVGSESSSWGRSPRLAWLVLERAGHQVVQFNGPVLELLTDSRIRFDQRLAGLGPDVLAPEFDVARFVARLRGDDPTRGIGDALLDQRNVAGIGNLWKSEGCWGAALDPWRPIGRVSDAEAVSLIEAVRPRMQESARTGDQSAGLRVFRRNGRPCPRCATTIRARGQGDDNRTTFWCPGCQL
jgi:endonuclease VIII